MSQSGGGKIVYPFWTWGLIMGKRVNPVDITYLTIRVFFQKLI